MDTGHWTASEETEKEQGNVQNRTSISLLSNSVFRNYITNKLAKLGDAIAISKSETINHGPTHSLTH